jgi:hypothetical protein
MSGIPSRILRVASRRGAQKLPCRELKGVAKSGPFDCPRESFGSLVR